METSQLDKSAHIDQWLYQKCFIHVNTKPYGPHKILFRYSPDKIFSANQMQTSTEFSPACQLDAMSVYNSAHHFIYLFGVLLCFQHCTSHIMMGSWKGRGNKYIQLVKVLYCKLPTNTSNYQLSHLRERCELNPASEVGGESITTLPPWPLHII